MKPYMRVFLALAIIGLFLGLTKVLPAETLSDDKNDKVTIVHIVNPYTGEKGGLHLGNGRAWNMLNDVEKGVFIAGVWQGVDTYLLLISLKTDTKQEYDRCFLAQSLLRAVGFYPQEIAKIVDVIYEDTSNIQIPITKVIIVATLKAGGASSQEIEKVLSDLRKESAKQNP
ncbi:MAG: hypothetical protein Q7J01_00705 [Syntrophales bacterium]|nr:hypothetical protein [Syntrophales bacterium]